MSNQEKNNKLYYIISFAKLIKKKKSTIHSQEKSKPYIKENERLPQTHTLDIKFNKKTLIYSLMKMFSCINTSDQVKGVSE